MQFPLQDSYQVLIMKTEGKNPHAPAVGAESSCFEYIRSILLFLAGPFSRDTVLPASVAGVLTETRHIHPKLPLVLLSYLRRDKKKKKTETHLQRSQSRDTGSLGTHSPGHRLTQRPRPHDGSSSHASP